MDALEAAEFINGGLCPATAPLLWHYPAVVSCSYSLMQTDRGEVTLLLDRLTSGDRSAEEPLIQLVYLELHRIAENCLARERSGHTLQPTALVNEAYVKLCHQGKVTWENRAHFYAICSRMMRRILTDHARQRLSLKRGSGKVNAELPDSLSGSVDDYVQVLAVDELLARLTEQSPRQAQIVEMRFFVGMTEDEIASVLGVSSRTVKRDWLIERAWLHQHLAEASHE